MANLLPGRRRLDRFPPLTDAERARVAERIAPLAGRSFETLERDARPAVDALEHALGDELDELEAAPSLSAAQAILARIDEARRAPLSAIASRGSDEGGAWLWYRPGRSLETGEAEILSRGFFDVRDRPPIALWIEARARAVSERGERADVAVLCWVPGDVLARADAGIEACSSGALLRYSDLAEGDAPDPPPGD